VTVRLTTATRDVGDCLAVLVGEGCLAEKLHFIIYRPELLHGLFGVTACLA